MEGTIIEEEVFYLNHALRIFLISLVLCAALYDFSLVADPVWGKRIILHQPDGTVIQGLIYGDEFYKRIETEEGFTIILNDRTGEIEYAVLQKNRLHPSGLVVGKAPVSLLEKKNMPRHLSDRTQRIAETRAQNPGLFHDLETQLFSRPVDIQALTGTKKVFVICVQFQPEGNPPTQWSTGQYLPQDFGTRLFSDDPSVRSMTNFYKTQSHDQFWPEGDVFTTWVTLPETASYYKESSSWRTILIQAMDSIKSVDPAFDFTRHADNGQLDVILIWAGTLQTWGTFYWPHMSGVGLSKYGVNVRNYNAVNERQGDGSENTGINSFCHEYGHMTGLPDLYDYSDFYNRPLGYYCLMGISDIRIGFCAFIKSIEYGWVEAEEISGSGSFTIDALGLASAAHPRVYKIYIDYPHEYFLLANRMNGSHPDYENFPYRRSGLLISHVDENYPPAVCLPGFTFYGVEAVCPALNPSITSLVTYQSYWDEMVWAADYGYSHLGPSYPDDRPPGSYLTLNDGVDTENVIYRNTRGHLLNTDIQINDISEAGDTMSFVLSNTSYTLILSAGTGGTTDPPPGAHVYNVGRQVTVEAVEDTFYSFFEWTGNLPLSSMDSRTLALTMDSDKTLTAHFKKIHPPLDFRGEKVLNRSLSQSEYINVLHWKSNPQNDGLLLDKYRLYLYSNGSWDFVQDFGTDVFECQQRSVKRDAIYSYALVAVDTRGREGEPIYVGIQ